MNVKRKQNNAITLIELVLSLAILSVIILYFAAFEQIGRRDVLVADRRAKVQAEVAFVLDHIEKYMSQTIGYPGMNMSGTIINPITITDKGGGKRKVIKFWVDANQDGRWDSATDGCICYQLREAQDQISFYGPDTNGYGNVSVNNCGGGAQPLSSRMIDVGITVMTTNNGATDRIPRSPFTLAANYILVQLTGCWDRTEAAANGDCGTSNNPTITMQTSVFMPQVSVH